jgi:Lon protease-like protein
MDELGLFPLGIVLLPTEQLPLHIFEERYKELIGECLEQDGEFGLVYADDDGLRDLGTRARVVEVLTQFEDGRLNILVEGGERFRLTELTDGRSFNTGLVASIDDEDDPADVVAVDEALRLFGLLRELTESEVGVPERATSQLSFALAGKVELPADDKLALLGETSERVRMELVQELLANAVLTAQRVRRAAERASTNGKVDLG